MKTMKNKKYSIVIGLIVVLILIISIGHYTGNTVKDSEEVIKIGYKANTNYIPLFIALENGYFEEEGVKVEIFRFDSTNTLMDSFAAGKLDATPTGNVIVSYSLENNHPNLFKIYSFAFYTHERHPENFIVKKGSGIKKYSDLKGKNIGANKGVFARTMTKKFLEERGIKDFEIIELSSSLHLQALEIGQIDALLSLEPNPTIGVERGIAEYLEDGSIFVKTTGFSPAFSGGVISTRFLKEHPIESKKFLRAMEKSFHFLSNNLEESKSFLPKYVPIEQEIAEKITIPEFYFIKELDDEKKLLIQKTADFLSEEKIIKNNIDTKNILLENYYLE